MKVSLVSCFSTVFQLYIRKETSSFSEVKADGGCECQVQGIVREAADKRD